MIAGRSVCVCQGTTPPGLTTSRRNRNAWSFSITGSLTRLIRVSTLSVTALGSVASHLLALSVCDYLASRAVAGRRGKCPGEKCATEDADCDEASPGRSAHAAGSDHLSLLCLGGVRLLGPLQRSQDEGAPGRPEMPNGSRFNAG